ncbi:hypothetical protein ACNOYE_29150 [Nannocystaceae bacterium ST9]
MSRTTDPILDELPTLERVDEPELSDLRHPSSPASRTSTSPPPRPRSWMRNTRRHRPSSLPARTLRDSF